MMGETKRGWIGGVSVSLDPMSYAVGFAAGGGGGDIQVQTLRATANGTYRAPDGRAYTPVYVAVPEPEEYAGSYSVTPGDSAQVLRTGGLMMAGDVTVGPIPSNYGKITWNGGFLTVS